jgi:uncharacterized protein (DUF1697 family)
MGSYGAFIKRINFRKERMAMAEVCAIFHDLGFRDVHSVLATGNIIFTTYFRPQISAFAPISLAILAFNIPF